MIEGINNINILDVVSPYVKLKKSGKEWKGLCPFHNEKTPSFFVNPDKGVYYCHGCHKGGNAVSFIAEIENVDYRRAEQIIAKRFGLHVELDWDHMSRKERYSHVVEMAADIYSEALSGQALKYLYNRGVTDDSIRHFKIGYGAGLLNKVRNKEHRQYLEDLLLIRKTNGDGRYYESLRHRIIFPIWDDSGYMVGLGGRIMSGDGPKYLNSRFKKERVLYGLNFSSREIKNHGYAVIVEGYLDMISLYQAGIKNVVAVLSSALTIYHVKLLKKYTDRIVLMFDPDTAGMKATLRAIEMLVENGVDIMMVQGIDDDPDAYIREHGVAAMKRKIESAVLYFDTIENYDKKLRFMARLKNPPLDYIKRMAAEYGEAPITIKEKVEALKKRRVQQRVIRHTSVLDLEREAVAAMVNNMSVVAPYIYLPLFKKYKDLAEQIMSIYEEYGNVTIDMNSDIYRKYSDIIAYGYTMKKSYAIDVAKLFLKKYIDIAIQQERNKMKFAKGDEEIEKILVTIKQLKELGNEP